MSGATGVFLTFAMLLYVAVVGRRGWHDPERLGIGLGVFVTVVVLALLTGAIDGAPIDGTERLLAVGLLLVLAVTEGAPWLLVKQPRGRRFAPLGYLATGAFVLLVVDSWFPAFFG